MQLTRSVLAVLVTLALVPITTPSLARAQGSNPRTERAASPSPDLSAKSQTPASEGVSQKDAKESAPLKMGSTAQPPLLPTFIPPTYAGRPFGDSRHPEKPQRIPGRLECELYDVGGPGVAYADSDDKNSGSGGLNPLDGSHLNGFRANEAVDISYTKDRGQPTQDFSEHNLVTPDRDSLYVGWTAAGEWISYTVAVEKTGTYTLDVMYTSNGEGRFEVLVDDVLRETVTLPTTHVSADPVDWRQWHHWNKLVDDRPIDLLAGLHSLRIRFLAGNTNLDYIEFRPR